MRSEEERRIRGRFEGWEEIFYFGSKRKEAKRIEEGGTDREGGSEIP